MPKKKQPKNYNVELMEPGDVDELKKLVGEFIRRLTNVENEISALNEDKKTLISEFSDKLDMKTLTAAIKAVKLESSVAHKDTFDLFVEVLKDDVTNGLVE